MLRKVDVKPVKKKQLLAVISIVGLLMIAFFWGGINKKPASLGSGKTDQNAGLIDGMISSDAGTPDDNQDNKHSGKIQNGSKEEILSDEDLVGESKEISDSEIKHTKKENINTDITANENKKSTNEDKESTCTLSITCKSILDNIHLFDMDKLGILPEDGIIYKTQTAIFSEGESVFDILLRETKKNKIHMEFAASSIGNSNYVKGINNLYEFDCGGLSGWRYKVNGRFPDCGCNQYMPQNGDVIEWIYSCDLRSD